MRSIRIFSINYFSSENIEKYIEILNRQTCVANVSLYILDNSVDVNEALKIKKILAKFRNKNELNEIVYIESPVNKGFGEGHNYLFELYSSSFCDDDILIISNNDIVIEDESLLASLNNKIKSDVILSPQILAGDSLDVWFGGAHIGSVSGFIKIHHSLLKENLKESFYVPGTFMCMRAELFNRLGGFDSSFFMYAEDLDLCIRARRIYNIKIQISNERILHLIGSGFKADYSELYLYEGTKNLLICMKRHKLGLYPISLLFYVFKFLFLRMVQLLVFEKKNKINKMYSVMRAFLNS